MANLCLVNSGLIEDVNRDRKTHYKRLFMLLTQEFWFRSVVPAPFNIVHHVCWLLYLCVFKRDYAMESTKSLFGEYWHAFENR